MTHRPAPRVPTARRGQVTRWDAATRTLVVDGDVDHRTLGELREALHLLDDGAGHATVDLRRAGFFPSSAAGALAEALRRRADPADLEVLVAEGGAVAVALRVLGVPHRVVPLPDAG